MVFTPQPPLGTDCSCQEREDGRCAGGSTEEPRTARSVPADPASLSCPGPRAATGTVARVTQLAAGALSVTAASSAALQVTVIQVASNQGQQWSGIVCANVFFRLENQAQLVSGAWLMLLELQSKPQRAAANCPGNAADCADLCCLNIPRIKQPRGIPVFPCWQDFRDRLLAC